MLNVNLSLGEDSEKDAHEAIKKANKAKEIPTLEQSWELIFSRKNSKPDLKRLEIVKGLMEEGKLGREEDKLHKAFSKAEALRLYKRYQETMRDQRLQEIMVKDNEFFPLVTEPAKITKLVHGILRADGMPLLEAEHMVSVDTETVGEAGGVDKYQERIAGWSLTYKIGDEYFNGYIPIEHYKEVSEGVWEPDERNVQYDIAMNALLYIFRSGVDTVWHNATFDLGLIYTLTKEEPVGNVHDTMIIMHLLQEDRTEAGKNYRLKDLATEFLGIESQTFEEMFGKNAKFSQVPLDAARWYGAKDTWVGYKLLEWQVKILSKPQFAKILRAYNHIEMPCIRETFHTERTGFSMNMTEVEAQKKECEERIEELKASLSARFGEVNFGSPAQLQRMLYFDNDWSQYVNKDHKSILDGHIKFDENGVSNNGKFAMTKSGSIILDPKVDKGSTVISKTGAKLPADSDALKSIAKHAPEVKDLLELKDLTKHLTSFVEKIPKMISPDGRLHGDFKQSSTVTLRYTASNPKLNWGCKTV